MSMRIVSPGTRTRSGSGARPAPRTALPSGGPAARTAALAQRPGAPGTRPAPARPAFVGAAQPRMVAAQNVPPHIRARSAALAASRAPQPPARRPAAGPVVRRVIEQEPAVDVAAVAETAAPDDAAAWSDPASREALLLDLAGRLRMASIELGELSRRGELEEPKSLAEQLRDVGGTLAGIHAGLAAVPEIPAELDTGDRWQLTMNVLADLSDAIELIATRVHAVEQLRVARLAELVAAGNLEGANAVLEGYTETIRAGDEPPDEPEPEPAADEVGAPAAG